MDCHNFGFGTGYEIFNERGILVESKFDKIVPEVEGRLKVEVKDKDGNLCHFHEQPMRSLVAGFLWGLYEGYRFSYEAGSFSNGPVQLGRDETTYTVNTNSLPGYYTYYTSSSSKLEVEDVSESPNSLDLTVSYTVTCTSNDPGKHCKLVGLANISGMTIAIDHAGSGGINLNPNEVMKFTWILSFPLTSDRIISKNIVYNLIQNLIAPHAFINISGTPINGVKEQNHSSYAKAICLKTCDIIIGTSDVDLSTDNYNLKQPLTSGLSVSATVRPSSGSYYRVAGNTAYFTFHRSFQNTTASPVTIREAGVVSGNSAAGLESSGQFLLARWLTDDIILPPDYTLRVYFQPAVTA